MGHRVKALGHLVKAVGYLVKALLTRCLTTLTVRLGDMQFVRDP